MGAYGDGSSWGQEVIRMTGEVRMKERVPNPGRENWNLGNMCCGNEVQWKLSGIYKADPNEDP